MKAPSEIKPTFKTTHSVRDFKLSVSPNKRYFVNQNGEPFFYMADTVWTLFKRLNHEEVDEYLKNRRAKGFNVIQAYVLRGLDVANLYGHLPLVDRDPEKLDEGFFGNIDYIINRANELGLVMGLVTTFGEHVRKGKYVSERFKNPEQIFNISNAFEYGRLLGKRYKDNCVIWLLGGDRKPIEDMDIWDAMGRGLKEGSQGIHLVSFHGPGHQDSPSSSYWFHNHEWLDFNTIQSGHGWAIPNNDFISHDYGLIPIKPTLDMEARYEDHPDYRTNRGMMDAHQAREAAYWAVLAGAAGHGYGNNNVWQLHDDTKVASVNDYTFPLIPPGKNWRTAMDSEGAFGVGYMHKLVELRPWYKIIPDQAVIASGQGVDENHIQAARAEDGGFVLAYLTFGNPVGIHMDRISGEQVKAQWYNPREGTFTYIGQYENKGVRKFTAPTSGEQDDWLLVLEDVNRNYPIS